MTKPALISLPLLALLFAAFLGCPSPVAQGPADQKAAQKAGEQASGAAASQNRDAAVDAAPGESVVAKKPQPGNAEKPQPSNSEPVAEETPPPASTEAATGEPKDAGSNEKASGKQKPAESVEGGKTAETAAGELFAGWKKPQAAIVITGGQAGYIEPCGCAGLENQKGGLRRRHTFLKSLADRGWPVAALDNGGLISRFGQQSEIKFDKAVEGLKIMGYSAVGSATTI